MKIEYSKLIQQSKVSDGSYLNSIHMPNVEKWLEENNIQYKKHEDSILIESEIDIQALQRFLGIDGADLVK